jgi:hypothetical protein
VRLERNLQTSGQMDGLCPPVTFNCDHIFSKFQTSHFALSSKFACHEGKVDDSNSSNSETQRKHQKDDFNDQDQSTTQYTEASNNNEMCLADWRWAASKRFWDPERRCWNEEMGGMAGYIAQRNKRRSERKARGPQVAIHQKGGWPNSQRHSAVSNCESDKYNVRPRGYCSLPPHELESPRMCSYVDALGTGMPLMEFMVRHGWGHLAIRGFWSAGCRAEPVVRIFHELPPSLHAAIGKAIDCAQYSAVAAATFATNVFNADFLARMGPQEQAPSEAPEWEGDSVHAFFELHFDPDTQMRVGAAANTRAANLLGMQLQELLARLEQHDAPLPLGPLDAVAIFLHALRVAREEVDTCYHRLSPSACQQGSFESTAARGSPPPPPVLVCSTTAKAFDAFGRVYKVASPTPPHPSQDIASLASVPQKTI